MARGRIELDESQQTPTLSLSTRANTLGFSQFSFSRNMLAIFQASAWRVTQFEIKAFACIVMPILQLYF
jgi:hypothetical protein